LPAQKKVNHPPASPPEEVRPAGFSFRLDSFRLEQGALSFEEPATPLSLNLLGLKASVYFDNKSRFHQLYLNGKSGSLLLGQGKVEITGLEIKAAFNEEAINLDRVSLSTEKSSVGISGVIENYLENPGLNLKTAGRLGLSEPAAMLLPDVKLGGELGWELTVTGNGCPPEISGALRVPDLEIYGLQPVDLRFDISPSGEAAHLVKADVSYQKGQIHLEANLPPGLKGNLQASISLKRLDLRVLQAFLPDFPVELASEISGRLEFQAVQLSAKAIKGLAELKLEPLAWAGEEESRPAIPVSGDLNLSYSDGSLTINKLNLALLNSQLEVGGRLELPEKYPEVSLEAG